MKVNKVLNIIIAIVGIIILTVVLVSNIVFTSNISNDANEVVSIKKNGIFTLMVSIPVAIGLYTIGKTISNINIKNKNNRILAYTLVIILYVIIQVLWIIYRNGYAIADQLATYDLASKMFNNADIIFKHSKYLTLYPQQLTLAVAWNFIFNILRTDNLRVLQIFNALANAISLVAIYFITKLLGTKYKVNKLFSSFIFLAFLTIPLLSTFVYGDQTGLAFALLSVYFIMKYGIYDKKRDLIYSAIFMAISYILRMNNLIIILAIIIYLILNILKEKINLKELWIKIGLLILFIAIAIMPATVIKKVMQNKYELNKNDSFPVLGFICMGMEESPRQAGWYSGYADYAWDDIESSKQLYPELIKERIIYFKNNPKDMIDFYARKVISMWDENTYSSVWYNQSFNFGDYLIKDLYKDDVKDAQIISVHDKISLYQKGLMFVIFGISLLVILQNRKNLSNELILLLTIFIGGFLFHMLWEAKSRYIIGYIVMLIPITSIVIEKIKFKSKLKFNLNKKTKKKGEV